MKEPEFDLTNKSPLEIAQTIAVWREDEDQGFGAAFDLLNAIEDWLLARAGREKSNA